MKPIRVGICALLAAVAASGCGDVATSSRGPSILVIESLTAASGADPQEFGGTLNSDVITNVTEPAPCSDTSPCPVVFPDLGQVRLSLAAKNQASTTGPTDLNTVTITRYRVEFSRADGHNVQGVDVPYAFDSAMTFTVPVTGDASMGFELVRHVSKQEAPLLALKTSQNIISTIAKITFYGTDQAGNVVNAVGSIGISFGNFADPE
ncbi:MAG TPA: hypothetical protein VFD69_14400 [Vicinamibacterales bacterium]|nr:hypothetical protein [Vicinamibacterales bacterium]